MPRCRPFFARHIASRFVASLVLLATALCLSVPQAQAAPLPAMKAKQVSVSGLSSGAYMAVQFGVAYSAIVEGAGVIAGGPYYCARGNVSTATTVCSCTTLPAMCHVSAGGTDVSGLAAITSQNAGNGSIDPVAGMNRQRIWLFSGSADTLVPTPVMDDLASYYQNYVPAANIRYKKDLAAQHAMPTDFFGNGCSTLGSPYISNCGYDAAGELLKWIYGTLVQKSSNNPAGRFISFDQAEFLGSPQSHGMAATGVLYVPPGCDANNAQACKLHVAFHGCKQDQASVSDAFIRNAGYNGWADANNILVLYPQAAPVFPMANPNACWDWFSYDDPNYAKQSGRQMKAVKLMIDRLTGGSDPGPGPGPATCFNASNYTHVQEGRAHTNGFYVYANGSEQRMGLNNIFTRTTLKRTAPDYYEIGTCP
ncbi:PHB depolymerase family esterase [Massilia sp. YIM B04103]|uniref:extracellular catalytic domain type 2 short-chain-length polyhydroxyalkanoate depolymerase n=1 Tax=Massilia sp. YIM B04103 TaxID=2963106 RepID=UPI00210B2FCD|nr:PHB depolymerase family esterase [Massilia sp. YIM B04103]